MAGGKGKGIIGALNYLAGKGMNSVYFVTYNIDGGDGKDVWPWVDDKSRDRFDCSRLDQWEVVFEHMDKMGLLLHVITQETENDQGLDGGELGRSRKLYYRELIARFSHHPGLVWNLGEENTNTDQQRKAFASYIRRIDAYDHPIVMHTFPGQYDQGYKPLLGFADFEGASLQTVDTHRETKKWIELSAKASRQWFVCLDEYAQANVGVKPDADDPGHDQMRKKHLWGNLMAGGAGVEWYFGYSYAHNDLNCEDWTSRENMWDMTRYGLEFFQLYLPFAEMHSADDLVGIEDAYCFAKAGQVYAVYLASGGEGKLDLKENVGSYSVRWYDPRNGGRLQDGTVKQVSGGGIVSLGFGPADTDKDWVVLVERK